MMMFMYIIQRIQIHWLITFDVVEKDVICFTKSFRSKISTPKHFSRLVYKSRKPNSELNHSLLDSLLAGLEHQNGATMYSIYSKSILLMCLVSCAFAVSEMTFCVFVRMKLLVQISLMVEYYSIS